MMRAWRLALAALAGFVGGAFAGGNGAPQFYLEMVAVPGTEYWVGKYEVTQKQYADVTGENPSRFRNDSYPVDSVSWDDAVTFCEKLTARERAANRLAIGYVYNLPTDAQWDEFAAGTELAGVGDFPDPNPGYTAAGRQRDGQSARSLRRGRQCVGMVPRLVRQ